MPVLFDTGDLVGQHASPDSTLRIAVVNNMGDDALKATERHLATLLEAASEEIEIRLSWFTLPGMTRTPALARHVEEHYGDMDDLFLQQMDGVIVTGREPTAAKLHEEPYWKDFTRLVEWARESSHSTIWSCLAAHAAVLHLDKIERVRRDHKLFGVFDCRQASRHPLLQSAPPAMRLPHSRWNGIEEEHLLRHGYEVLTRSDEAGVDTFIKQSKALFVFFQGHPEYAPDTLMREYRRDVGRFMRGETNQYPALPCHYFDPSTSGRLTSLASEASAGANPRLLAEVGSLLAQHRPDNNWLLTGSTIYRNWIRYLVEQKSAAIPMLAAFATDLTHVS